jgi:hypothetical protein
MPDFSEHSNTPFSSAGDMKFHLQTLLDSKEKQLQQAGTLGQRVLAQQMELEERIKQLQEIEAEKSEDDEIDEQARVRYRELADTLISWDTENAQLSSAFGSSKVRGLYHMTVRLNATEPTLLYSALSMAMLHLLQLPLPSYPARSLSDPRTPPARQRLNQGAQKMRLIERTMLVRIPTFILCIMGFM